MVLYKASPNHASVRIDFEQKYPKLADIARWEPLEQLADFITHASDSGFRESCRIDSVMEGEGT